MPGIVGIISQAPNENCQRLLKSMIESMRSEQFYISGNYCVPDMGIYVGWIAQEGSFAASQVFANEEHDIGLIFAGECFGAAEINSLLKAKGHALKNRNDWLVHLYEEEGDKFFEKLNGLFSGLLIDKKRKTAFLFNDRYGAERIYWHETKDAMFFASEAKALLSVLPNLRSFDDEGVAQFLALGCTIEDRTLFRGIRLLPPGSLWAFGRGGCNKSKYFSPKQWESQGHLSADDFQQKFEQTFRRVLPRYFESELRVGISLTAGLDSRMIMACLPESAQRPVCYTFSGEEQNTLDSRLAARISEMCGLEHMIFRIGRDFFTEFASLFDRTVYVTDGCLGTLGVHEIYFNRMARALAPVRLTGVFGGEILRGVSMFKPVRLSPGLLNGELTRSVEFFARQRERDTAQPVTFAAFREIPEKRFGTPAASRSQVCFRTPYLDNEIVAVAYQIPPNLRTSPVPAYSIVADNNSRLGEIPTDMGPLKETAGLGQTAKRFLLRAAFKLDYIQNEGLPHWLSRVDPLLRRLNSSSRIFGLHKFLHYRSWLQRELAPFVNERIHDAQIRSSPFWNPSFLDELADEHCRGRKNYLYEVDAVLTLEAVERLLFRNYRPNANPESHIGSLTPSVQDFAPEKRTDL